VNAREGRKQRQTAREQRPYNGEEREVRVRIEESELAASCSAGPEVEEQQVAAALGGGAVGAAAAYLVTFFKPEIHVQVINHLTIKINVSFFLRLIITCSSSPITCRKKRESALGRFRLRGHSVAGFLSSLTLVSDLANWKIG
jgi:hypothetical protein